MPRIIDVDTEAFAPTYQKAYKEREPLGDVSRRRMAADFQLLGQAMPYVSEGIKGIDQYLVTPIQQAMKESREEEYKAKKAGEMPFEMGETTMQKLAKQRLAEKEKQKPFDTSAWEKEAEEMYDITKMKGAPDLEAQRPDYGAVGEEAAKMFGEERPEFGELSVPVGEAGTDAMIARQRVEQQMAQRLKEQEQAGPVTRPTVIARHPVTGELRAVAGQPSAGLERGSPAYEMEVSRQRTGLPRKPAAAAPTEPAPTRMMPEHPVPTGYQWPARGRYTAPGAPTEGFAGAEAPAEPTQTAQMAKTATTTARAGARTAAEPVAPTEPAKPKTLATVTDDELSDVKRRLEKMVEQNPEDKELADRLEMVNLEQRHRGEKMEYEDWAAMARAADTVEEQRKVLEMAKRARMPVEGLESLLTSPFERAKLKALGAKGEKGLFPEVARPLNEWEVQKKQMDVLIAKNKAKGMSDKEALDQAKADYYKSMAGRARAQAEDIETMLEPKYAGGWEKVQLLHAQEQKATAESKAIMDKLPGQMRLLDAQANKLRAAAAASRRGGRGVDANTLAWAKLLQDRYKAQVDDAMKPALDARNRADQLKQAAVTQKSQALRDQADIAGLEAAIRTTPSYEADAKAKLQIELTRARSKLEGSKAAAEYAQQVADEAAAAATTFETKATNAIKASEPVMADIDALVAAGPAGAVIGATGVQTPRARRAAPAAAKPAAAAAPAPAAATHKEGDESKDKKGRRIVWHNGKWTYPD